MTNPTRALLPTILLALTVAAGPALADSPAPDTAPPPGTPSTTGPIASPTSDIFLSEYPFRSGEKLTYDILVLGVAAGKGTLAVGKERAWKGRRVVPVHGTMTSEGFWNNVYPVTNRMVSLLPRDGGYPLHTEMSLDQNGSSREMTLDFDPINARLRGERVENKKDKKTVQVAAPPFTQDALSWFYHLRFRDLQVGRKFKFKGYSGKFFYTIHCDVEKEEEVWTRVGFLPAMKVNARITRDGDKRFLRTVTFWLGTDEARLPLKMSFDFTMGHVEGILASAVVPPRKKDAADSAPP